MEMGGWVDGWRTNRVDELFCYTVSGKILWSVIISEKNPDTSLCKGSHTNTTEGFTCTSRGEAPLPPSQENARFAPGILQLNVV
jgi:allantoicase